MVCVAYWGGGTGYSIKYGTVTAKLVKQRTAFYGNRYLQLCSQITTLDIVFSQMSPVHILTSSSLWHIDGRRCRHVVSIPVSFSWISRSKYWPGDRLSVLGIVVVFLCHCPQMLGEQLKSGLDRFIPHSLQLIIHSYSSSFNNNVK
jgi:hypothetical protein